MTYTRDMLRSELNKRMPGLKWTVRVRLSGVVEAKGRSRYDEVHVDADEYGVTALMFAGTKGFRVAEGFGATATAALRALQDACKREAQKYGAAADFLEKARVTP